MNTPDNLLLLTFISLFLIILVNIVVWAAVLYDNRRQRKTMDSALHAKTRPTKEVIPKETRQHLQELAAARLEKTIEQSAMKLSADLTGVTKGLTKNVDTLTTKVIEREVEEYRKALAEERKVAVDTMSKVEAAVEKRQLAVEKKVAAQQAALEKRLEEEALSRQQRFNAALDARFSDVVASYLIEALGDSTDLGSQAPHLIATLEANKEQLKKEITRGL